MIQAITKAIVDTNNDAACVPMNAAKIQKFTILPADFSVQTNELAPAFKLKRSVVAEMHAEAIAALYDPSNKATYIKHPSFGAVSPSQLQVDTKGSGEQY